MGIKYNLTCHNVKKHGHVYIFPTIRVSWEQGEKRFNFVIREFEQRFNVVIDFLWLIFKVTINI